jgi:hypothetical protein
MSIRVRVTLVTVMLVAIALAAADFTAYALLRSQVYRDADKSVRQVAAAAVGDVNHGRSLDLSSFSSADRPLLVQVLRSDGQSLAQIGTQDAAALKLPPGLLKTPGVSQLLFDRRVDAIAVPAQHGDTVIAAVRSAQPPQYSRTCQS